MSITVAESVSLLIGSEKGGEAVIYPSWIRSVADSEPKLAAILRAAGRGVTGSAVRDRKRMGKLFEEYIQSVSSSKMSDSRAEMRKVLTRSCSVHL